MPRRHVVLDVFTSRPFEGNPLAVVLDADGLDTAAMQRIAREFNLSETVFVLPAERPSHSARLRIFTPAEELPFAGHPTVGTAALLAVERFGEVDRPVDSVVVIEEPVGVIRAAVRLEPKKPPRAEFTLPRLPHPVAHELPGKGLLADALGLDVGEIGFENHVPSAFEAGVPFCFVPLVGLDALARANTDRHRIGRAFGRTEPLALWIYCRETVRHDSAFHARMFDAAFGIGEDPATGAAVAAFAGAILRFDGPTEGSHRLRIEQGYEMGRPSLIDLSFDVADGALTAARIGGSAVVVSEGRLAID
jgi:trans-2,3-dihydro-3-hydroxyanthranilate isomerase